MEGINMLKYSILSLVALSLVVILSSCQQTEQPMEQYSLNDSPDFLLIDDEDPLNIETESAFMIDGTGPLYFSVLNLTDDQKEQIREIVGEFRSEFAGMCGKWRDGTSWEDIKEERQALHDQIHAAIYEILTDEQKAILDDIQNQLENGQYPDLLVENKVARLTEALNLTDDQQNALTDLFKEYGTLLIATRDESGDKFEFIKVKMELFMELDGKIEALLTDEQLELYDALKAEHRENRFHHHRKP
jgi:Spy/CpxP family protein refolding chaperone